MATVTKITLSPEELQLVTNSDWILTKRIIIDKVFLLLGELSEKMKSQIGNEKGWLPQVVSNSEPKIYKGENYLQLPYVTLDYPRCFGATDIFAIRTMFWWGNFFSISIHLGGTYKEMFGATLMKNLQLLKGTDHYICINTEQWQHHFEEDNYIKISSLETTALGHIIAEKPFVKLAQKFSLPQWEELPLLLELAFAEILRLLKN